VTTLVEILLGAAPGYGAGIAALIAAKKTARRQARAIEHLREELQILLVQQQTEYRDGIGEVGETLTQIQEGVRQTEEALQGRLTSSQRSSAMQLMRSGLSAERVAGVLAMSRAETRLIATVSRFCRP
jgi:hypothetical protein